MSNNQKEILAYCLAHSTDDDQILKEIDRMTHLKTLAPQMISGSLQGKLLKTFSILKKPKSILEIGTFTGYGTLCLAAGLKQDGFITTIEVNPELAALHKPFFEKSQWKNQIKTIQGDATKIIPILEDKFDLVFIDAGKQDNLKYLELVYPKLENEGMVLIDNTLWGGKILQDQKDTLTQEIDNLNKLLQQDSRFEVLMLPIRDGLSVLIKK